MKNKFLCIGLSLLLGVTLLSACNNNSVKDLNFSNNKSEANYVDILSNQSKTLYGKYNEGVVLVKTSNFNISMLGELKYDAVNQLYKNSSWYEVKLSNSESTEEAVNYLSNLNLFEKVDFDYVMGADGEIQSVNIEGSFVSINSTQDQPWKTMNIYEGWKYQKKNGGVIGGTKDVIVAVIDTGVDYDHIDLRNNIWINSAELNGLDGYDDDGNGYVDDIYGWNCVADNNNPKDDNGHGTHVAGIIAAQNNDYGMTGIAYNCQVMCIKAGNSSGNFNNSDVAEAIQYAYMNGASVINMSFGGPSISIVVRECLENAFNQCVLVAASGNDYGSIEGGQIAYPAALNWVIGVDSCDSRGIDESEFGNCDMARHKDLEYEVYACGEDIISCFPNNKYATMSGTSMAAPAVSAIAALMRSNYSDREVYSNKYIQSQIVNTGELHPLHKEGGYTIPAEQTVVDFKNCLSKFPTPDVHLLRSYIFDSKLIDSNNDGDGIADAGETIHIACDLYNYGGVAANPEIKIDVNRNGDSLIVDPYVEIINDISKLDDIGTYSIREGKKILDDDGNVVDMENSFTVKIANDIPNDYKIDFNYTFSYKNGLDKNDSNVYENSGIISVTAFNGITLSGVISENTTFTNINRYIIPANLVIAEGVTVTFEEGCEILFYESSNGYHSSVYNSPAISVYGTLIFNGSAEKMINLRPTDSFWDFEWSLLNCQSGCTYFNYCNITNMTNNDLNEDSVPALRNYYFDHCHYLIDGNKTHFNNGFSYEIKYYRGGMIRTESHGGVNLFITSVENSIFDLRAGGSLDVFNMKNCVIYYSIHTSITFNAYNRTCSIYKINYIDEGKTDYIVDGIEVSNLEDFDFVEHFISKDYCSFVQNNMFMQITTDGLEAYNKREISTDSYGKMDYFIEEINRTEFGQEGVMRQSGSFGMNIIFTNNVFMTDYNLNSLDQISSLNFPEAIKTDGNLFLGIINEFKEIIFKKNYDSKGNEIVPNDYLNHIDDLCNPYIKDISIYDKNSNKITSAGNEEVFVEITFSKDVSNIINDNFKLYYGSSYPYKDYAISGKLVSPTIWRGSFAIKSFIEGGKCTFSLQKFLQDNSWQDIIVDNSGMFGFDISVNSALSMNLQATATNAGIELSFNQDDYDTLMGYNIYRSTDKDGNFVKINPSVISKDECVFFDDNVEPGVKYWYTFTVVLSDMNESIPAGKVSCTAFDTIAPNVYHTAVNQGYLNNNLVISCTASDNIAVQNVCLKYRIKGETNWKSIEMLKQNNRYSATIFGSELSLEGIEYYIVASDGFNTITKGSETSPYTVIIKDASAISHLGDVDGDGVITTKDALMIMQSINGDILLTDDQFKRADLNSDGVLSSIEALRILQYINGNVSTLEM